MNISTKLKNIFIKKGGEMSQERYDEAKQVIIDLLAIQELVNSPKGRMLVRWIANEYKEACDKVENAGKVEDIAYMRAMKKLHNKLNVNQELRAIEASYDDILNQYE